MPVMPPGGILRDGSSGEVGHQKEEKGVSGHMQIEIHQTVHQEPATGDQAGKV